MFSPLSSKRRTSRSPDPRPSKRQAPSTPEEGEVDDGGPSQQTQTPQLVHASLPPKPVTDTSKSKAKVKFPFKTKKTQAPSEGIQNVFLSRNSPPPRGSYERDDDMRYGRDVELKDRRNGSRPGRGDHWEPGAGSRRDRRSRSRSRSYSPPEKHRLPSRRTPEPAFSPPRGRGYDREDRRDYWRRGGDRDRDLDYRDRDRRRYDYDDDDRYYRPQSYSSRRGDDYDRGHRDDYYPRRRSNSRSRREYDSYRPVSPDKNPPDFARTPPGQPPPPSPSQKSSTLPSERTVEPAPAQPLPPPPASFDGPPPPPPRTPPPVPPPDSRTAHLDKLKPAGLPEKPKALYIPVNPVPTRPPQAPRDAHSPLRHPAPTDRYKKPDGGGRDAYSKSAPKEPPRIRIVKRRPAYQPSKKEEMQRFGRLLKGCGMQEDYEATTKLGEGTFGEVHKAVQKATGKAVALKRILMHNEKEGMPVTALREIKILKAMSHPCIIEILDMFIVRSTDTDPMSVYMVFPYMDHDLAGLLENERVKLQPSHIKLYMKQLLEGTAYMHRNHILHRDMKAANLLISNTGSLRIADFGLARTYEHGRPLDAHRNWDRLNTKERKYTNCVVTRWYRPPELLMGARNYGDEVDIWGIGCILGEMFNRRPILPGNSDIDQLERIWQLCGTPNQHSWPNFDQLPGCEGIKRWNTTYPRKIRQAYEVVGQETCDLLDKLLTCNPQERITAEEALNHDYFWTDPLPADPKSLPIYEASHEFDKRSQRMHQRPPPAAVVLPPPLPPPHRHEPQHRAMAIPHFNNRGPGGPPGPGPPPAGYPPGPPPIHYTGGLPPGVYSMPHPPPGPGPPGSRFDARSYGPPGGGGGGFPPRGPPPLMRNGPYNGGGGRNDPRQNRPPPRNSGPGPKLSAPGLPQRPADPQGRNAAPPMRGGDLDADRDRRGPNGDASGSLNYD
ncbi:cmgc cdk cdk9 protein kinase [Moniliophthora roreri]|uniref:Putative CMGC/CDK/CDK9 protein kinase n=1 Tax=Moniliophthora roreri TaxID=221103 RepID=A0A0W0FJB9_MONRR|nr:cmgc cdk cdk9 protein kinase [Moniliophthora roreri]